MTIPIIFGIVCVKALIYNDKKMREERVMKRKTKVLIIAGACLLVVGVGTGITVHNVKVNTSTMGSDMSASEETVVADKDNNDSSKSSK